MAEPDTAALALPPTVSIDITAHIRDLMQYAD
jgi:hypothetical protein